MTDAVVALPTNADDERYMKMALAEAREAADVGDVPVGCVIVRDGRVIARARNQRELLKDPTAHAEVIAIGAAAADIGLWRLDGCTLYVTLEPCTMCAGAIVLARVPHVVFGAHDPKAGACGSLFNLVQEPRLNHRVALRTGVLGDACGAVLKTFFQRLRGRVEDTGPPA